MNKYYTRESKNFTLALNLKWMTHGGGWKTRVKYLNREDIEELLTSLGFEVLEDFYSNGGFNQEFLSKLEIKVEAHKTGLPMLFIFKKLGLWYIEIDETIRVGGLEIKNKSELIFQLKRLGIYE